MFSTIKKGTEDRLRIKEKLYCSVFQVAASEYFLQLSTLIQTDQWIECSICLSVCLSVFRY